MSAVAGALAIVVTSVLWGTTGTAAALAPGVSAPAIGAVAMGVGGILQSLVALPALRSARSQLRARLPLVLLGAASVAVYPLAFYASMRTGGVAIGTVISLASAPLVSAVIERVVDRTRFRPLWALAATLGIGGSALLCLPGADSDAGPSAIALSALLGIVAGGTYAIYSWTVRRLIGHGIPRSASMGAVFGIGGLALMPVMLLTAAPVLASAGSFLVAAYLAVVPMFLGYLLFGIGLARIRASTATTITLLEPAVATVLAFAVLGERLDTPGWIGLAIVGLSLVVTIVDQMRASGSSTAPATPPSGRQRRKRSRLS